MELYLLIFTALFSVVNPLGAMPIYVTLTEGITAIEQRKNVLKISLYIIAILLTFYFAGNLILAFFGIELTHIKIAGGIMICISAMSLLGKEAFKGKPMADEVQEESMHKNDITFTPMAMPMLSGPGSIALVIGFISKRGEAGWITQE